MRVDRYFLTHASLLRSLPEFLIDYIFMPFSVRRIIIIFIIIIYIYNFLCVHVVRFILCFAQFWAKRIYVISLRCNIGHILQRESWSCKIFGESNTKLRRCSRVVSIPVKRIRNCRLLFADFTFCSAAQGRRRDRTSSLAYRE